ncbi:MAG: hypothetical protein PHC30_01100, partial [Lentisphaeria bacterium]|nr:hypothetical protein [Lentisphaeria bacterium]
MTRWIQIMAVWLAAAVCLAEPTPDFVSDCARLGSGPHRLSGTDEYDRAADYVRSRLQAMAPDAFVEQPFATTQVKVQRADLTLAGGRILPLLPMRPNGIIPPVTPPAGVTGPIVHMRLGTAVDFEREPVEGALVVLDYNCGQGWLRALRLGAKAVIFTRPQEAAARHPHHAESNVNLLRFYYDGPAADLPAGDLAVLHSSAVWAPAIGRNLFAFFEGTDPVFAQSKEEVVILAVNLDSFGDVPALAPAARQAANAAALLHLAETVSRNRPRRHTLIAFFDQQARGHLGSSYFYRALETDKPDVTLAKREESYAYETAFMGEMRKILASDAPLSTRSADARRRFLDRLADKAQQQAHRYKDQEFRLNDELLNYRKMYGSQLPDSLRARVEEIAAAKAEVIPVKQTWNELQREIGRQKRQSGGEPVRLSEAVQANLDLILGQVRDDIEARVRELEQERAGLDADGAIAGLLADRWIALHASLLLGDTSERWGLVIGGESAMHSPQDNPGLYGKIQAVFLRAHQKRVELGLDSRFLPESADQTLSQTRVLWGAPALVHSGEPAGLFGIYNLCLGTVQEATPREGTPHDTLDRLDLPKLFRQVEDIAALLFPTPATPAELAAETVGSHPGLSLRRSIVASKEYVLPSFDQDNSVKGPMVMGMLPGTSIPNTPMADAVIQFRLNRNLSLAYHDHKAPAFDNFQVLRTNRNGSYALGPVTNAWGARGGFATIFDQQGLPAEVSGNSSYTTIRWRLNTFRANAGCVVLPSQQRTDKLPGEDVKVMSARANADLDRAKSFSETADGVACWYAEEREKGVKLFSLRQMVGLNNGPQFLEKVEPGEEQIGEGFPMSDEPLSLNAAARSAADLWRLNESRMEILRAKGILDSSLAEMHGRSEDILLEAARAETPPMRREALVTTSFWASRPVYQKVRAMLDDLVFAVLILLGLSVPFAFALERVLVGATTIYRQIYWFVIFFAATFLILYLSHPAFAIANTPIIIFLGFAIVVMSVMVIFIIMRKFEYELKAIQGMTATVHVNDVSNVST